VNELDHFLIRSDRHSDQYRNKLAHLKEAFRLDELMYLHTCNRVTFFFTTQQAVDEYFATRFFKFVNPEIEACKTFRIDVFEGNDALRHLCEISASLDSMVLGEREILRQLRVAYEECNTLQLTGDDIRLAIKYVIPEAKRIYSETKIAEKPVSVVSLAFLEMQKHVLTADTSFLLIGAGETMHKMCNYLLEAGFKNFTLYNRTLHKGQLLASKMNGKAYTLDKLNAHSTPFDVLISCTASSSPVLTKEVYSQIAHLHRRKIMVDLAQPHDISPEVIETYTFQYIEIDTLHRQAAENLQARKAEKKLAVKRIDKFLETFGEIYFQRRVERAHQAIPGLVENIRNRAIQNVFNKEIEKMDEQARNTLFKVIHYMEKKYIALTIKSAKETSRYKL
ncbi:MAG: hypothetical protein ACK4IY_04170, partial [Chitinophagales bacterium]